MNKKKDVQNYTSEMIEDDKNKISDRQLIVSSEQDKNLEEELLRYVAKSKAIFKSQQKK